MIFLPLDIRTDKHRQDIHILKRQITDNNILLFKSMLEREISLNVFFHYGRSLKIKSSIINIEMNTTERLKLQKSCIIVNSLIHRSIIQRKCGKH